MLLVGMAVWGISTWLLQDLDKLPTLAEQVSARIEAVRTALAAGAGVGAAMTLLLAVRRQQHQELAAAHTMHDAAERRTTELYTKAADQLGSDQAPVRLAGLYALERLGEHTPVLQQRVVDVICAYLRMPWTPPAEQDRHAKIRAAQRARTRTARPDAAGRDPHEERQVRVTAQRILSDHLRHQDPPSHRWWQLRSADPNPRHWRDIRLDLTGAVLIDHDFNDCRVSDARFGGATFTGGASFNNATFTGGAYFGGVTFVGGASFGGVTFTGGASFSEVTFTGGALFVGVTFTGDVVFLGATFTNALFGNATFTGSAWFSQATFTDDVSFKKATFTDEASFDEATFTDDASFDEATFTDVSFDKATFTDEASFVGATFTSSASFDEATFTDDAAFLGATFTDVSFDEATFTGSAWFDEATFTGTAWFGEATFSGSARFEGTTGLERAGLNGTRVAPAEEQMKRVWPSCWQAVDGADGWQTLRLPADADARGPEESRPGPGPTAEAGG
ncbi:pentapeptide repeat-containing protein [Nonomuraea bangladeshensis]|uniref:pentapeptide repeat-containing protein n=1 Tax=Nonomuraea bangladeshensis TaxID=404385 RepID=UPI003C2F60F4